MLPGYSDGPWYIIINQKVKITLSNILDLDLLVEYFF